MYIIHVNNFVYRLTNKIHGQNIEIIIVIINTPFIFCISIKTVDPLN